MYLLFVYPKYQHSLAWPVNLFYSRGGKSCKISDSNTAEGWGGGKNFEVGSVHDGVFFFCNYQQARVYFYCSQDHG